MPDIIPFLEKYEAASLKGENIDFQESRISVKDNLRKSEGGQPDENSVLEVSAQINMQPRIEPIIEARMEPFINRTLFAQK